MPSCNAVANGCFSGCSLPLKATMMHDCATLQRVSPNRNNACGFGSRLTDRHKARETERALTLQHVVSVSE
uniref:Uncharacterized protein n=1 Tax=Triticum urartu TaxID=4572 RepID=A0A8R7UHY9_TRIUA